MARKSQPELIDASDLPLSISDRAEAPGYVQVGQQLKDLIESRALRVGAKLPSTRALAGVLGVNRNTIVAAFEWLANAGLVEARGRAGTVVSDLSRLAENHVAVVRSRSKLLATQERVESSPPTHDFRLGSADPSPLPVEVWRRACREAGRHLPRADYGDPRGDEALRKQVVLYLGRTRGLRAEPHQVLITAGAGQAIERIAEVVLGHGDHAAMEDPGYPRAARAFQRSGATVVPVEVDQEGIDCDQLMALRTSPRLVHVTPSHQYPLGARLSAARRQQLIQWAHEKSVLIIENDYDGEFRYGSAPLPALGAMTSFADVAYVGTFSKVLTPAIRLGFFIAHPDLIEDAARVVTQSRDPVSIITQRIVCWLIASGELEKHIRRTRRQYAARRAVALRALAAVRGIDSVSGHAAGLHLVASLREEISQEKLMELLMREGLAVDRVSDLRLRPTADSRLLLAYAHLEEEQIRDGVAKLATAIALATRTTRA